MVIGPLERFVRLPRQVSADLGGETALLSLDSGVYYGLNEVGAEVWALLETERSPEEVADVLATRFDILHARALSDACDFIERLVEEGLVERTGP